jgi:hypothetical protein
MADEKKTPPVEKENLIAEERLRKAEAHLEGVPPASSWGAATFTGRSRKFSWLVIDSARGG